MREMMEWRLGLGGEGGVIEKEVGQESGSIVGVRRGEGLKSVRSWPLTLDGVLVAAGLV